MVGPIMMTGERREREGSGFGVVGGEGRGCECAEGIGVVVQRWWWWLAGVEPDLDGGNGRPASSLSTLSPSLFTLFSRYLSGIAQMGHLLCTSNQFASKNLFSKNILEKIQKKYMLLSLSRDSQQYIRLHKNNNLKFLENGIRAFI